MTWLFRWVSSAFHARLMALVFPDVGESPADGPSGWKGR